MRRRGVLHIGVTGLAAMLVQACAEGQTKTKASEPAASSQPAKAKSTLDPSVYVPAPVAIAELKKLYNYDNKSTLNAELTDKRSGDGIILEDITYSDTRGRDAIPAYVVGPETFTGRLPAVVFAPSVDGNRDALLNEAMEVARLGALVFVPQLPVAPSADPVADSKVVADSVVALRRGFDLLIRRTDCDGSRVGFAGHHWGAALGAILYGVETRITATVLAAGTSRWSRWMVREKVPADWHAYLDALARFDALPYVGVAGRKPMLLQYGKQDDVVVEAERAELLAGVAGPKERKDYDTGHDLVTFQAAGADRVAFLRKQLRLK